MRFITAVLAASVLFSAASDAQPKGKRDWHEKMKSEKIAFITTELELTPEEAQVFWPVYNQIAEEARKSNKTAAEAFKALTDALEDKSATDDQINKLLDEYLAAKLAKKDSEKSEVEKYRKVLPAKKVAKLYTAEEKFRRHHIRNFKGNNRGKPEKK